MKKTLRNIVIGTGLVIGSLAVGAGCSTIYEKDPLIRQIVGGLPRVLQPGAYRDAQEKKMREEERQKTEDNIQITTPQGYKITLNKDSYVYYQRKECFLWDIAPPHLYISFPESEYSSIHHSTDKFRIKINDLDMFNE